MSNGYNEFDVTHTLTTYFLLSYLYAATLADDTFIADTFVFTAVTLVVFGRTEDTLTEQTVTFGFVGTIVNRFRFEYLTRRDLHDLVRGSQTDSDLSKTGFLIIILFKSHFSPPILFHVNTECKTLQFVQEHVKRLGQTRCREGFTFDDCLIGTCTTGDIIRLDGKDLLEHMSGTVCLQCPNLHLSETLTTELSFTSKRLLGNQAVRTDRTGVHLIIDHVTELHEVSHTDSSHLVERLTGLTIIELCLTGTRQTGFVGPLIQLLHRTTITASKI